MTELNPSSQRATDVFAEAVAAGVRHIVVSPGARSQALALRAATLAADGQIALHVRTDERSAAFLALGIALETGDPAIVVTTSGSAVAQLLPAVLEAHHAGVPMLILSADRPAELRGRRANQTTRQDLMLRPFVRELVDVPPAIIQAGAVSNPVSVSRAIAVALGQQAGADGVFMPGPVQLNLQFIEPLSGPAGPAQIAPAVDPPMRTVTTESIAVGSRTVVVAGMNAGDAAEECARALGAPLIGEIASGAHFGPNLVVAYRQLLRLPEFAHSVERVIVFGTPSLSREVIALCAAVPELVVVDSAGVDRYWPAGRATEPHVVERVEPVGEPNAELSEWARIWTAASRKLLAEADAAASIPVASNGVASDGHVEDFAAQREYVASELAAIRAPLTRERLVNAVWAATWPNDRLLLGASRLIRVADGILPGKNVTVFANRGQSGIDGTIATGMGIAVAHSPGAAAGTTRVLLGDLAVLHDAGSMRLAPGEPFPRLQVIVGNDRGGTIFTGLEVATSAESTAFERVLLTPHDVDLAALASAYGWEYRNCNDVGALDQALSEVTERPVMIEVPLQR